MPSHNIFRDGKVHVASKECATCIFKPHTRPVDGARVAGMVRDTKDEDGSSVVCHTTLYKGDEPEFCDGCKDMGDRLHPEECVCPCHQRQHAVCRGWFDRLADRDNIFQLAIAMGVIEEQEVE